MPGFGFGLDGPLDGLPGLGAAGAGPRGARGEVLGEWHGDGAPKVVLGDGAPKVVLGTPDSKYGTSSRELEGVVSVVAATLADALSPSTGWRPSVAASIVKTRSVFALK